RIGGVIQFTFAFLRSSLRRTYVCECGEILLLLLLPWLLLPPSQLEGTVGVSYVVVVVLRRRRYNGKRRGRKGDGITARRLALLRPSQLQPTPPRRSLRPTLRMCFSSPTSLLPPPLPLFLLSIHTVESFPSVILFLSLYRTPLRNCCFCRDFVGSDHPVVKLTPATYHPTHNRTLPPPNQGFILLWSRE
ncbi:hypothetical protein BHM03_00050726, partial [Ensete ventricosum]